MVKSKRPSDFLDAVSDERPVDLEQAPRARRRVASRRGLSGPATSATRPQQHHRTERQHHHARKQLGARGVAALAELARRREREHRSADHQRVVGDGGEDEAEVAVVGERRGPGR